MDTYEKLLAEMQSFEKINVTSKKAQPLRSINTLSAKTAAPAKISQLKTPKTTLEETTRFTPSTVTPSIQPPSILSTTSPNDVISSSLCSAERLFLRTRNITAIQRTPQTRGVQRIAEILCGVSVSQIINQLFQYLPPTPFINTTLLYVQKVCQYRFDNPQFIGTSAPVEFSLLSLHQTYRDAYLGLTQRQYNTEQLTNAVNEIFNAEGITQPSDISIAFHLFRAGLYHNALDILKPLGDNEAKAIATLLQVFINKNNGNSSINTPDYVISECSTTLKHTTDPFSLLFAAALCHIDVRGKASSVDSYIHANLENYVWYFLVSNNDSCEAYKNLQETLPPYLLQKPDDASFFFLILLGKYKEAVSSQTSRGEPHTALAYAVIYLLARYNVVDQSVIVSPLHSLLLSVTDCYQLLDCINETDAAIILTDVCHRHNDNIGLINYIQTRPTLSKLVLKEISDPFTIISLLIISGDIQTAQTLLIQQTNTHILTSTPITDLLPLFARVNLSNEYFEQISNIFSLQNPQIVVEKALENGLIIGVESYESLSRVAEKWKSPERNGTRVYVLSYLLRSVYQCYANRVTNFDVICVSECLLALVSLLQELLDDDIIAFATAFRRTITPQLV
ncbi:Nuclear pore protein [Entamoeba marina]